MSGNFDATLSLSTPDECACVYFCVSVDGVCLGRRWCVCAFQSTHRCQGDLHTAESSFQISFSRRACFRWEFAGCIMSLLWLGIFQIFPQNCSYLMASGAGMVGYFLTLVQLALQKKMKMFWTNPACSTPQVYIPPTQTVSPTIFRQNLMLQLLKCPKIQTCIL